MAENREWFEIPDQGLPNPYPNLEAADTVAQRVAAGSDKEVEIVRHVVTVVRRYRREVTVTAEDVSPPA